MKITLIRHTNVAVLPGTVYGFTDVDVAPTFQEEARAVFLSLAGEKFDKVYSSPLLRCKKLAAFCGFPHAVTDDRLKELNFGKWEMQRWENIQDPLLQKWYENWVDTPTREGESLKDQYRRVADFLESVKFSHYRHICLFVHSGVIRCVRIYAGQTGFRDAFSDEIPFGSKTTIDIG